jgi:hypothetical protein
MRTILFFLFALALMGAQGAMAQAQAQPGTCLVIVDDLHLDFRDTPRLRALIGQLTEPLMARGDRCGIASTSDSRILVPTSERPPVQSAITRVVGMRLRPSEMLGGQQQEVRNRAVTALTAARGAIDTAAGSAGGQTVTVLYVSDGYDVDLVPERALLVQSALRANAVLHTIAPRAVAGEARPANVDPAQSDALVTAMRESLTALASPTKGTAVFTAPELAALQARLTGR